MERKKANTIKIGDKVTIEEEICTVKKVEVSKIGKHGKSKVRIEADNQKGETKVIIRPSDFEVEISQ
ncbi:MAG: hypothetical protein Q8R00_02220 [Candidatus Nanoarchaeia archaeon]|nr:hypothetical protein [Candidatus Nanoarchaeia archaeon]